MLMCDQYASACACDCTRVRVAEQQRTRGRGFARVCQSLPEVLVCVCDCAQTPGECGHEVTVHMRLHTYVC